MRTRGFALAELVVIVVIIALLLGVVLYATSSQPQAKGNAQRRVDVNALLHAIEQYTTDHQGQLPGGIDQTPKMIASTPKDTSVNLCQALSPTYLPTIPIDLVAGSIVPQGASCGAKGARYNSGYLIHVNDGHVTVVAPSAENGEKIFASN
jgi:type II secretory pathway pseudopilin PulG